MLNTNDKQSSIPELSGYDLKLYHFICEYNAKHHFPATLAVMIENLPEKKSKSTVFHHLQKLVNMGYLIQIGEKRAYIPVDYKDTVMISISLLDKLCSIAEKSGDMDTVYEVKKLVAI